MSEALTRAVHLDVHICRQPRILAHVPVLLANPEENEARGLGAFDLEPPEELGETERKEAPVEIADELVDVGQSDGERRRLTVDRDDAGELGLQDELHVSRRSCVARAR